MIRKISQTIWLLVLMTPSFSSLNLLAKEPYEQQILELVSLLDSGDLQATIIAADEHLFRFPKSRIAHLIRADALSLTSSEAALFSSNKQHTLLNQLKQQIAYRWRSQKQHPTGFEHRLPAGLVDIGTHDSVLIADLAMGRLYFFRNVNGVPELDSDYYLSIGSKGMGKQVEGDNKTPIGVYAFIDYIPPHKLADLYGAGALPVDYPNALDEFRGRTGYGIWLHGTPSTTFAREPWASRGCIVVSNTDFAALKEVINTQKTTPILFTRQINWIDKTTWLSNQDQLNAELELNGVAVKPQAIFEDPSEDDTYVLQFSDTTGPYRNEHWQKTNLGGWQLIAGAPHEQGFLSEPKNGYPSAPKL